MGFGRCMQLQYILWTGSSDMSDSTCQNNVSALCRRQLLRVKSLNSNLIDGMLFVARVVYCT
jgi:hypothetical protein